MDFGKILESWEKTRSHDGGKKAEPAAPRIDMEAALERYPPGRQVREAREERTGGERAGSGGIRPLKELKGFERVSLRPGEAKTVTFKITPEALRLWSADMKRVVEPGDCFRQVAFNIGKIISQADFIQRRGLQPYSHGIPVAVDILTLSLVAPQEMGSLETFFHDYFIHCWSPPRRRLLLSLQLRRIIA